jgi:hypothetical protein
MPRKKLRKKNYPAACGERTDFIFTKNPKKVFSLQNETKMIKSVTMTLFSIFSCFSQSAGLGRHVKKISEARNFGQLALEEFLKY